MKSIKKHTHFSYYLPFQKWHYHHFLMITTHVMNISFSCAFSSYDELRRFFFLSSSALLLHLFLWLCLGCYHVVRWITAFVWMIMFLSLAGYISRFAHIRTWDTRFEYVVGNTCMHLLSVLSCFPFECLQTAAPTQQAHLLKRSSFYRYRKM